MSHYSKPLDRKRKEIRLLILQPLSAGTTILCSTQTASLLDEPEYEALSYVWGTESVKGYIMFDGEPFTVTNNLATALHHLRLPGNPRRLWVDAICINQSNTKERNEQVILMGEIYASAKPVLVWLGEASEGSDEGFGLISTIANGDEVTEAMSQTMFEFYIQLVEREWFSRLWTVQELVLATQDPLVGCGFSWTTWSMLFKAWQKVAMTEFSKMGMVIMEERDDKDDEADPVSGVRPGAIKVDLLNNLRTAITSNGGEHVRNLLLNTVSSKATEPRDRVYALLGMMRKEDREHFTVDYSRTLGTVFAEAVAHIFQFGNGLWLLSGMELAGPSLEGSFPSWVPIFGSASLLSPTRLHTPGVGASGAGSNCVNGIVDDELKTLRVRGLPIDVVTDTILFGEKEKCLTQLSEVEALASQAHQLAKLNSNERPYLNRLKSKEPIWRTLIANKAYSGAVRKAAPETYGEMYKMLLQRTNSLGCVEECVDEFVREYRLSLLNHLPSGSFFITATGFYGITQLVIEEGDHLAIWFGAPAPFVLKPNAQVRDEQGNPAYAVRGVAYVAGIMNGEMVDEVYCEDLEDDIVFTVQ